MRGTKAKRIRREIYGDFSHRARDYEVDKYGTIRNTGKRREYLDAKRMLKALAGGD